mgnify:CR=1 FL=1
MHLVLVYSGTTWSAGTWLERCTEWLQAVSTHVEQLPLACDLAGETLRVLVPSVKWSKRELFCSALSEPLDKIVELQKAFSYLRYGFYALPTWPRQTSLIRCERYV